MRHAGLLFLLMCWMTADAGNYPQGYFRSPMDIPIKLSGNFGELRPNHFHAGIDITTSGQEGLPVKASAEGYVSRIKISPFGYGKAIYVTHPNGYTTVYAHLKDYNGNIAEYITKQQYLAETFEIELFPAAQELPVKQGQVLGYSGNTGSSGGPHLHFEIRDTKTEAALNPLLFGLPVKDDVAPTAVTLAVFTVGEKAYMNSSSYIKKIPLIAKSGAYEVKNASDSIVVYGDIGFGIEAYDQETVRNGKNGVYEIELFCDGKLHYRHQMNQMPFDKSRYINCFVDYAEHQRTGKYFQRSFLVVHNELPIYDSVITRGVISFSDGKTHQLQYKIRDVNGNTSVVKFKVRSLKNAPAEQKLAAYVPFKQILLWNDTNLIEETHFTFKSPAFAFYNNVEFTHSVSKTAPGALSPKIILGDKNVPIHKPCTLAIACSTASSLHSKLIVVKEKKGGGITAAGGRYDGKSVTAEIKEFGTYYVMADTTAPTVRPYNFDQKGKTQTDFSILSSIQLKVGDNLSGISTYRGSIDGKWVLFEYEPKKDLLFCELAKDLTKGKHTLVVTVTDKTGNATTYTKDFTR